MTLLDHFPRIALGHFPTPLEPMDNLRRALGGGGPRLFIKRDDCTGLATGGNKTRKLEYLIGDAIAQSAQVVVTQGAVQSNHVRQTAAAAAKCDLSCVALLERRVPDEGADYEETGNVLLNDIFNARYEFRPDGVDMNAAAMELCETMRGEGKNAYFIPGGGSNEIGALGYVRCAFEMLQQAEELGVNMDRIVHATGSAGTQAGLLAGLAALKSSVKVTGVSVRAPREKQQATVMALAQKTSDKINGGKIRGEDVIVNDKFAQPGYGRMTKNIADAITLLAQTEGILLDPVYSGKGFAAFIADIREGAFEGENVIFLHTGGSAALFAYRRHFSKAA